MTGQKAVNGVKRKRFAVGRYGNCFLFLPAVWVMRDWENYYIALGWLNFGCNLVINRQG